MAIQLTTLWKVVGLLLMFAGGLYVALHGLEAARILDLTDALSRVAEEHKKAAIALIDSLEADYAATWWHADTPTLALLLGAMGFGVLGSLLEIMVDLRKQAHGVSQVQRLFARPFLGILIAIALALTMPTIVSRWLTQ